MAKIVEYDATIAQDKISPTNTGYSANELAARRVGQFAEQEAQGVKEVAALEARVTEEAGQQATAFLRLQGLEDRGGGSGVKAGSAGGMGRTLIGTGANSGITYNHLQEFHGGPSYLSRVARNAVTNNNQMHWDNDLQDYVSNNSLAKEKAYWDKINQKTADQINKDTPDPAKEMADIYKEANASQGDINTQNAKHPDYMGPGASFNTTTVPAYNNEPTGSSSGSGETSSDQSSGWGGIWSQLGNAFSMGDDSSQAQ